ncbi:MAG: formyltransferase family protein [Candidatus Limnocylindrales bacterium]
MSDGRPAAARAPGPAAAPARRIRVYVAGAPDAPLTIAALEALARNPAADLVGIDFGRMDPARLRAATPDLLVSAAHEHLIRGPELAVARLGSVGLHPALLPRYRGSHPLWWALRNHEAEVGLTLYVLDEGIDTGPVIAQATVATEPGDTFGSLYRRVAGRVAPMLDDLLAKVVEDGRLPPATPQDHSRATVYRPPTHRELHGSMGERAVRKVGHVLRGMVPGRRARAPR